MTDETVIRTSNENCTVEFVWLCTGFNCSEIYLYDAGRCVECHRELKMHPAWRRTHETCDQLTEAQANAIATSVVQNVCELPDYNSPDDQPELLQCTVTELHHCVMSAIEAHPQKAPADTGECHIRPHDFCSAGTCKVCVDAARYRIVRVSRLTGEVLAHQLDAACDALLTARSSEKAGEQPPWPWQMCTGCGNEPNACTCDTQSESV